MKETSALRRRAGAMLAALCAAVLVALPVGGASAKPDQKEQNDIIYALSGENAPTDYIVVIDNSVSMREFLLYRRVLGALRTILPSLPSTDHLSLITFNSTVELAYTGPMANPVAEINRLPNEVTSVPNRDIGQALEAVVNALERPGASPTAAVLLFTNGPAEPTSGTDYPVDDNAPWEALRARVEALDRPVNAVTFRFGGSASGADIERVFGGDHTLVGPPPEQLASYLQDQVNRQRTEIAKDVAAAELARPIAVDWRVGTLDVDSRSAEVELTLRWGTKIPLELTNPAVAVAGLPDGRVVDLPDQVTLDPATGTATITGRLEWGQVSASFLNPIRAHVTLTLTSGFDSSYRQAIQADLGIQFALVFEPGTVEPGIDGALNWQFLIMLAVLAMIALASFALLWVYRNPSLAGTRLEVNIPQPTGSVMATALLRRRRHAIGGARGSVLTDLPGEGAVRGVRRIFGKDRGEVGCLLVYERRTREKHTFSPNETLVLHGIQFTYRR